LIGTTRDVIFKIAKKLGIKVREVDLKLSQVVRADEIFITNAPKGIVPVREVISIKNYKLKIKNDGGGARAARSPLEISNPSGRLGVASQQFFTAPGPVTKKLMGGFREYVALVSYRL